MKVSFVPLLLSFVLTPIVPARGITSTYGSVVTNRFGFNYRQLVVGANNMHGALEVRGESLSVLDNEIGPFWMMIGSGPMSLNSYVEVSGTNSRLYCGQTQVQSDSAFVVANGGYCEIYPPGLGASSLSLGFYGGSGRAVVADPGSILHAFGPLAVGVNTVATVNSNCRLEVTRGGAVNCGYLIMGNTLGTNNVVMVDGPGTEFFCDDFAIYSVGATLVVSNGARFLCRTGFGNVDGPMVAGENTRVSVPRLRVSARFVISPGAEVVTTNLQCSVSPSGNPTAASFDNLGSLFVTNSPANGMLRLYGSPNVMTNRGTLIADRIECAGYSQSPPYPAVPYRFFFPSGLVRAKSAIFSQDWNSLRPNSGNPFTVGDGTNTATYHMDGGAHAFYDGMVISSNSVLKGCGLVTGGVTNYGTIILSNGCGMEFFGPVHNYGSILALNGVPQFHSNLINAGVVRACRLMSVTPTEADVVVQFTTLSNYSHTVEWSSNLSNWAAVTHAILGTGLPATVTDVGGGGTSQRFYRLVTQ